MLGAGAVLLSLGWVCDFSDKVWGYDVGSRSPNSLEVACPGYFLVSSNLTGFSATLFDSLLRSIYQGVVSPWAVAQGFQARSLHVYGGFCLVADLVLVVLRCRV